MPNLNKQLPERIGTILNKDYFKLEFGCKVKMNHNIGDDYDVVCAIYHGEKFAFELSLRNGKEYYLDDIKEIIGTEPSLNDLLMAIRKCIEEDIISHSDGYELVLDICYRNSFYDLSLSLFNQTEETKQKLLELLK